MKDGVGLVGKGKTGVYGKGTISGLLERFNTEHQGILLGSLWTSCISMYCVQTEKDKINAFAEPWPLTKINSPPQAYPVHIIHHPEQNPVPKQTNGNEVGRFTLHAQFSL